MLVMAGSAVHILAKRFECIILWAALLWYRWCGCNGEVVRSCTAHLCVTSVLQHWHGLIGPSLCWVPRRLSVLAPSLLYPCTSRCLVTLSILLTYFILAATKSAACSRGLEGNVGVMYESGWGVVVWYADIMFMCRILCLEALEGPIGA